MIEERNEDETERQGGQQQQKGQLCPIAKYGSAAEHTDLYEVNKRLKSIADKCYKTVQWSIYHIQPSDIGGIKGKLSVNLTVEPKKIRKKDPEKQYDISLKAIVTDAKSREPVTNARVSVHILLPDGALKKVGNEKPEKN